MAKTIPPPGGTPIDPARRQAAQQSFVRAQEVFKKGEFDYAIKLMKDACKLAPDQLMFRQFLRVAAKKKWENNKRGSRMASITTMTSRAGLKAAKAKKDYYRALECCENCLSENPWDSSILLEAATVFEELKLFEHAVWSAESALERDSMDVTVNKALASLYERTGAFTKAMDCLERVKKARPGDDAADRKLKDLAASATIDKGGYEGAQSFTRAVADKTKTQELLDETKGGSNETRYSAQIADLEAKVRVQPTVLAPYLQLSQILRRTGKLEQARQLLEKAKDATGGHADALAELGEIEVERLKHDLAIAQKQAAEKPNDAELQQKSQELARTLNDFELREFQRRTERNPTDNALRVDLGVRLAKAGLYDQAIPELQKGQNSPARKTEALIWLGRSFHAKKQLRLAKKKYEEALDGLNAADQKGFLELHYLIGRACDDMGDKPAASQHYEEVISIDYGYRDAAARLDAVNDGGPPAAAPS